MFIVIMMWLIGMVDRDNSEGVGVRVILVIRVNLENEEELLEFIEGVGFINEVVENAVRILGLREED